MAMWSYHAFGGVLHSALEFPDLPPASSHDADWTLTSTPEPAPPPDGVLLGRDQVEPTVCVQARRCSDGLRLDYEDTGTFVIGAGGRTIAWHRPPGADDDAARLDVLGRVLAMALHEDGRLALHASAVAAGGGAIAFLAPKHSGKSTLVLALANAGAELIADDMVPVDVRPPLRAWPGVPLVRLFADSMSALVGEHSPAADPLAQKYTIGRPGAPLRTSAMLLGPVYLLESVRSAGRAPAVWRERVTGTEAVVALLGHAKVASLLGGPEARPLLGRVAALAKHAEVFRLRVTRDYARLSEVADTILEWQQAPASLAAGAAG